MKIGELHISKLQLIVVAILLAGLAVGLYLVQRTQIFRPKAAVNLLNAFEITGPDGTPLSCTAGNPPTCTTSSLNVNIKLKQGGTQELLNP